MRKLCTQLRGRGPALSGGVRCTCHMGHGAWGMRQHASVQDPGRASQSEGRQNAFANNFALVLRVAAGERGLRAPCSKATCAAPNAAPTSTSPCSRLSASVCLLFQASLACPSTRLCWGSTAPPYRFAHTHATARTHSQTWGYWSNGASGTQPASRRGAPRRESTHVCLRSPTAQRTIPPRILPPSCPHHTPSFSASFLCLGRNVFLGC